jgi:hypothetical protein
LDVHVLAFLHLAELLGHHHVVERRQLQHEGEHSGGRREVDVRRDAELPGDVEHGRRRELDDERGGGRRQRGHGGPDVRRVEVDVLRGEILHAGAARGRVYSGEVMEAHLAAVVGLGGGPARNVRGDLRRGLRCRGPHDQDGEGEVGSAEGGNQALAGLERSREMAGCPDRQEYDGRLRHGHPDGELCSPGPVPHHRSGLILFQKKVA